MSTIHWPGVAIALAATAAFCFAGAAVLQHRAVSADAGSRDDGLSMNGLRAAARTPGWLLGLALAAGGTTLHAVALVLAPLSVVQPIGVLAVPIAVLISVVRTRKRPTGGVLVGVALSIAGVGAFVGLAAGTSVSSPAPDSALLVAGLAVALVVGLLAAIGLARSGWVRCVTCATAGAVSFGLVSALMRAVSQTVTNSTAEFWVALLDPAVLAALAGLAGALAVGGWLVQQAFASGPPEVVVACLTVVDPIVAVLLGVFLLGEGADSFIGTWLLLLASAAVATAGVVALASHHPDALARREAADADLAGSDGARAPRREHVRHR
jgi:drug/metabolite transporter (DMT)-like permease